MQVESGKNLAGIGAILIFVSFLTFSIVPPFGSGFIGLVGLVLMLLGVKVVADYFGDAGIFKNMLYGTIAGVVGIVLAIVVAIGLLITSLVSFLYKIYPGWNGDWVSLSGMTPTTTNLTRSDLLPFLTVAIAIFAILFIFTLVVVLFYRRSLSSLKKSSAIGLFGTTGTILLIGAVLTIILIGYIIIWLDFLLLAIAFFQIRPQPSQSTPPTQLAVLLTGKFSEAEKTSVSSSWMKEKQYCIHCGAELSVDALYCPICGKKQGG